MTENVKRVNNPLTVIGIFAGLSEIAGTVSLAILPYELQKIFIWFVMIFPFSIVAVFFFILSFKTKVLYAPSDYKDETLFQEAILQVQVKALKEESTKLYKNQKATERDETIKKIQNNISVLEELIFDNYKSYNINNKIEKDKNLISNIFKLEPFTTRQFADYKKIGYNHALSILEELNTAGLIERIERNTYRLLT